MTIGLMEGSVCAVVFTSSQNLLPKQHFLDNRTFSRCEEHGIFP